MNGKALGGGVLAFFLGIVLLASIQVTHDPLVAFILLPAGIVGILLGIAFIVIGFILCR